MPFRQRLDGLVEPSDLSWKATSNRDREAFYRHAGDVALERLKIQLSRGIGANGRQMKPRIRAVLPDGSDGPVMEPHYDFSRVITLSDYMATSHSLTMFWHAGTGRREHRAARKARKQKKRGGKRLPTFGQVLSYHSDGLVRNAPKRDVRLSAASIHQVRQEMAKWWKQRVKSRRKPKPQPSPSQRPIIPVRSPVVPMPPRPWVARPR